MLTKELVRLTISNNSLAKLRVSLDGSLLKLNSWLASQENRMRSLELKVSDEVLDNVKELANMIAALTGQVSKLEVGQADQGKESSGEVAVPKGTAGNWELF
jgi:hypothetical protein